jgi:type IV pilus assembly protein PilM
MKNPLTKILGNIGKLGGSAEGSAVGVDIGSSAIKVVEIRKRGGRAVLETYGAISLGPYADLEPGRVTNLSVVKAAEALKEVLKQSGVAETFLAVALPVQSSLIFILDLPPSVAESEIASVVPTEARKYIPVPITEVSLDYFILPHKEPSFEELNAEKGSTAPVPAPGEKVNVLVVATQNEAVSKYRSIVSECKLSAAFFEIEIFSSIRSNFEHELSPVLLVDLGASRTKLSIVEFGMVKTYHTIDRGSTDITASIATALNIPFPEAEKMKKELGMVNNPNQKNLVDIIKLHTDYIFSETNNVLLGYEKKYNKTVSKVIFSGGGSLLKGLREVAAESFRAEVVVGHPFAKVSAPAFLEKVLDTMGPEFAVALGLALRKLQ